MRTNYIKLFRICTAGSACPISLKIGVQVKSKYGFHVLVLSILSEKVTKLFTTQVLRSAAFAHSNATYCHQQSSMVMWAPIVKAETLQRS